MIQASSIHDYRTICKDLDELQGFEAWKDQLTTDDFVQKCGYDALSLEIVKTKLDVAIAEDDTQGLLNLFQRHLSRDIAGITNPQLYSHSHCGTKSLIDDYIGSVVAAISKIKSEAIQKDRAKDDRIARLRALENALRRYGRTALTLSGGATMGMKHIGVLKALWEAHLLPQIVSGTSAGSIVAAVMCCTPEHELIQVLEKFAHGDLSVFCKKDATMLERSYDGLLSLCARGALFEKDHLERVMKDWLAEITFVQAYHLTGKKLCIGVSTEDGSRPRLLNYETAPNVMVWSAV